MNAGYYQVHRKERDVESGLDNFWVRYFSASHGRFTSPDRAELWPMYVPPFH
jgi:hypothetical protein